MIFSMKSLDTSVSLVYYLHKQRTFFLPKSQILVFILKLFVLISRFFLLIRGLFLCFLTALSRAAFCRVLASVCEAKLRLFVKFALAVLIFRCLTCHFFSSSVHILY